MREGLFWRCEWAGGRWHAHMAGVRSRLERRQQCRRKETSGDPVSHPSV